MFIDKIIRYFIGRRKNDNGTFLFTIGYEGLKLQDFITRLKENDIKILVDVREIPWSRKRGFSKSQLEKAVREYGIGYTHIKQLGSPSVLRRRVREKGDYEIFFNEYKRYLGTQTEELKALQKMIEDTICCLMCYEKKVDMCHRKIIVSEIKRLDKNGLKIIHL